MASRQRSKRVISVVISSLVLSLGIGMYFKILLNGNRGAADEAAELARRSRVSESLEAALKVDEKGLSQAVVTLQTTRGKIRFKFYSEDAPKTVHRIAQLVLAGFYNGLIFHRAEPGFVIQGGDPTGTGEGGSGTTLSPEFNSRKHIPGTVALARTLDLNSGDSQFYITLGAQPKLDGNYTVFGQVIEGLEVANQIQAGDKMTTVALEFK